MSHRRNSEGDNNGNFEQGPSIIRWTTTFQLEERTSEEWSTNLRRGTELSRRTSRLSSIRRTFTMSFVPEKKIGSPPFHHGVVLLLKASCEWIGEWFSISRRLMMKKGLNLLLIFVPVSVWGLINFWPIFCKLMDEYSQVDTPFLGRNPKNILCMWGYTIPQCWWCFSILSSSLFSSIPFV